MKKIFMLVLTSAILSSAVAQKDTSYPCPKPVETGKVYPDKKKTILQQQKGVITGSFNDSVVVEDHTGLPINFPVLNVPERFMPPMVSNLKEIKGSFNRHISVKRFPTPHQCGHGHHYWYDDLGWLLWPLLFLLGIVALIILATRPNPTPSVTVHVPPTPAPPAPAHVTIVPPSKEEMETAMEKAKETGSIFSRKSDGGYEICFPSPQKKE